MHVMWQEFSEFFDASLQNEAVELTTRHLQDQGGRIGDRCQGRLLPIGPDLQEALHARQHYIDRLLALGVLEVDRHLVTLVAEPSYRRDVAPQCGCREFFEGGKALPTRTDLILLVARESVVG